jgi:hypothetical protein
MLLGLSVIFLVVFVVLGMVMIWAYIKVRTQLHHRASLAPTPPSPPLRLIAFVLICESMFGLGLWSGRIYSTRLCRQGEPRSVRLFRLCFVS